MTNKDISDFLLTEYENIAKAHFNSYDIGARWVRYYLIIVAVPFTFAAFIYRDKPDQLDLFNLPNSIAILLLVIGALNICVSFIIIDLKLDSVLYARTVNGIRKYFVEKTLCVEESSQLKIDCVLFPTDINRPAFLKSWSGDLFFLTIFMAIINSLYFSLGITQIKGIRNIYESHINQWIVFLLIMIIGLLLQYKFFKGASNRKEEAYCLRNP